MRPIFHGHKISLPKGATTKEAVDGLARMMATFKSGDLVFEEVWHNRSGGVDANEGGLTVNELQAILAGDPGKMRGIKVDRFLWYVTERRRGRPLRHNGVNWTPPATVVLSRCDKPDVRHTMAVDEVGVRFGRPHRGWDASFAATYNRRLDASLTAAQRAHANRDWRLLWIQGLYKTVDLKDPLGWWTRNRHDDLPSLLTRTSPPSMAALSWWDKMHTSTADDEDDDGDDPKTLVPRTSTVSLQGFLLSANSRPSRRTRVPAPDTTTTTHTTVPHANLYQLFRAAAGGQPVELRTLASYLGSSAHLTAMVTALRHRPKLPTTLLDKGGGSPWGALADYAQRLPAVVREAGHSFIDDLLHHLVAVEFPVYWCGLAADDAFVHSRIDALTRSNEGNVDVWEFKTKWSTENKPHLAKPLLRDLRQVLLYAYMLSLQTRLQVDHVHVRYATVDPTGRVTLTTHTYRFDPVRYKWAVADALRGTTAYVDARLATYAVDALLSAVGSSDKVMPTYQMLQLVGAAPLVDPRASAGLPTSRPPWVERLGALWVPAAPTTTVYGSGGGDNGHRQLDARVKTAGTELAQLMERRRCFGKLRDGLDKLYGPPTVRNEGRRRDTAEATVIRTLNRGINALVSQDARDAPPGFAHSSDRPRWSRQAIDAGSKHLTTVVAQVRHEIRRVCGR
jgi:hypothetical protein